MPTLAQTASRRPLTATDIDSWASAGLDSGRPGYTFGLTPQPHNEGNFTALGRVIRGMDLVDRLELGDAITATRMKVDRRLGTNENSRLSVLHDHAR